MFLVGILSWWYSDGLRGRFQLIKNRFVATSDFFSIDLLITTLFAPYRQISADEGNGPALQDMLMAFGDKLVSRTIGAVVRIFMIIFGVIAITVQSIFGLLMMIVWVFIPVLPIAGLVITAMGWVP